MKGWSIVVVVAGLCSACAKKAPAADAGAAPSVAPVVDALPSSAVPDAGVPSLPVAPVAPVPAPPGIAPSSSPLLALLPPAAAVYGRIDLAAVMSAEPPGESRDKVLGMVPPPCAALIGSLQELAVAVYAAAPAGVVAVLRGPDDAAIRSCAEGALARDGSAPRVETRGGRELAIFAATGDAMFAADATTHVYTSQALIVAALAAAAGGPALGGAPVLDVRSQVPAGAIAMAAKLPAEHAARIARGLTEIGDGQPAPVPAAFAAAIEASRPLRFTVALVLEDEAAATTMERIAGFGLDRLRLGWAQEQVALAAAPPEAKADARLLAQLGPLVESLAVAREGGTVRLTAQTTLTVFEFVGALSAFAIPAVLRYLAADGGATGP